MEASLPIFAKSVLFLALFARNLKEGCGILALNQGRIEDRRVYLRDIKVILEKPLKSKQLSGFSPDVPQKRPIFLSKVLGKSCILAWQTMKNECILFSQVWYRVFQSILTLQQKYVLKFFNPDLSLLILFETQNHCVNLIQENIFF